MVLLGFQMLLTPRKFCPTQKPLPHLQDVIQYVDKIVSTTNPAVLPDGSNVDEAPPPRQIPTSVTYHTLKWRTLSKTCQISLPHASDIHSARLPTAYILTMANRSAALATQSLCNLNQPLSQMIVIVFC